MASSQSDCVQMTHPQELYRQNDEIDKSSESNCRVVADSKCIVFQGVTEWTLRRPHTPAKVLCTLGLDQNGRESGSAVARTWGECYTPSSDSGLSALIHYSSTSYKVLREARAVAGDLFWAVSTRNRFHLFSSCWPRASLRLSSTPSRSRRIAVSIRSDSTGGS